MNHKRSFYISPVGFTLLFLTLVLLISDFQFRLRGEKWKTAISSDAYDYYRYLPMVFIKHDFDLRKTDEGKTIPIKHYVGTAIFFMPFFLIACLGSILFEFPNDGQSILFSVLITIGTLFYLICGLFYFSKFLRFYKLPEWIICLVLLLAVSATNIYYYTVITPGWSHIIAFFLISFILYQAKKIYAGFNKISLIGLLTAIPFLFWTRPTDIVVVMLIPFLAGDKALLTDTLKKAGREGKIILLSILIAFIPLAIQLAMYKLQTGHWLIWSYANEGKFNFLKPEVFNVLFSYAKGLFVYTPVTFISLFGLVALYKRNTTESFGIALFLVLNVYIISSWWCWNYGYCYGQRAFIDIYPVFLLLLALLLNSINKSFIRNALLLLLFFLSIHNGIQIYQCEKGILDMDFRTNKKGYWSIFLETKRGYSGKYYRFPVDTSAENIIKNTTWFNDMEVTDTSWIGQNTITKELAYSGNQSSMVNQKNSYSCGLIKSIADIPYHRNVLIRASGWFYIPAEGSGAYFAISFSNNWQSFNFNPFSMDAYTTQYGHWEYQVFEMYMPKLRKNKAIEAKDQIEFYLFNNAAMNCYVDDLKIEFIEFKKLERVLDIWWD